MSLERCQRVRNGAGKERRRQGAALVDPPLAADRVASRGVEKPVSRAVAAQRRRDREDVVEPLPYGLQHLRPQHGVEGVDKVQGEDDCVRARLGLGRQDLLELFDPSPSSDGALVSTAAVATAGLAELLGEREAHGSRRQPAQHGPTRDRPNPAGALRERDEHRAEVCLDGVPRCFANEEADQHCTRGVKPVRVIAQRGPVLEARIRRACAGAPRVRRNRGRNLVCDLLPRCWGE